MSARQYEKVDCYLEDITKGQQLEIVTVSMPANGGGECDMVYGFGNLQNKHLVWLPYNSKVDIEGKEYKVVRGELKKYDGDRMFTKDQSLNCLLDQQGNPHSLIDFKDKYAYVTELNNSRIEGFLQYLFDKKHKKLEPVDTMSFDQMEEKRESLRT